MLLPAVILAVGCPAIWIDTRTHRIPNILVAATLVAACAVQIGSRGVPGMEAALGGAIVGLVFLLPLHLAGAMGAGDVKFMAALGALLGPQVAVLAGALTLIAGSGLALATVAWQRRLSAKDQQSATASALATRVPYAAAIVTGALAASLYAA